MNDPDRHGSCHLSEIPGERTWPPVHRPAPGYSQSEVVAVAIVTVEERMRGWLAVIAQERTAIRQVVGYWELASAPARLRIGVGEFSVNAETLRHKEVSHEQEVHRSSVR